MTNEEMTAKIDEQAIEIENMVATLSKCWEQVYDPDLKDEIDEVTAPYTSFFDGEGNEVSWDEYKAQRDEEVA